MNLFKRTKDRASQGEPGKHTRKPAGQPDSQLQYLTSRGRRTNAPVHPSASTSNLVPPRPPAVWQPYSDTSLHLAAADVRDLRLHPYNSNRLDDRLSQVLTLFDEGEDEKAYAWAEATSNNLEIARPNNAKQLKAHRGLIGNAYFSKVWLYSNSRLPPILPPFMIYLATYPLLCLAARYSLTSYSTSNPMPSATGPCSVANVHVPPSTRLGTKAMTLALAPCTTSNIRTLVIAIRGSASFADWAINFRPAPTSPAGFLDDDGNLVHAGFLQVARSTLAPMAQQLQTFLFAQVDAGKWRIQGQLVLTGHSAGGAVASLLYCHLLSQSKTVNSPLKDLRSAFRRVHCLTFGVPPISLLPLERPRLEGVHDKETESKWRKNLFFSFINEGDPVVRADGPYARSLIALYRARPPATSHGQQPKWPVPLSIYSNAGKLIVLRPAATNTQQKRGFLGFAAQPTATEAKIEAAVTTDEQLRGFVFGDPSMHSMRLYKERVDKLALSAVTGE